MEKNFKEGLANQAMTEFENVRKLREEFIAGNASSEHIAMLEDTLNNLFGCYLDLTKPEV